MCTVEYTSNFDSGHFKRSSDGYFRYGIFGIIGRQWCYADNWHEMFFDFCDVTCDALRDDDITDDINCAKTILRFSDATMDIWEAFRNNCTNTEIRRYDIDCA
ncbi:lysozyme C-like [Elgaria multicarinata webbii]|uniref:lysozyme C-like n=1 Tax=Elgaria multicarinata webbii TaxID=159646 RepID=UPI002FCD627C